jgi:glycosyltransferase involved in cell wall biosynthesis
MALPLLDRLAPLLVVYDCMDELSAFKHAPRQMGQRETALLKSADLVVTGGPRLYEAKRHANANVLCVPSAVDAEHYSPERARADAAAMQRASELQGTIGAPRLGFFGVIDERLDLDLVGRVADADPAWQIVMVGPVVKIDESALPRRANLHWLGQQPYSLLPQLVAGWDVCLMPFALNESTEFISPTKTLEYLAAGKPVVSTPIHDVRVMFGEIVAIAATADEFIAACRAALAESPAQASERAERGHAIVGEHSWDAAAATIRQSLETVLAAPRAAESNAPSPPGGNAAKVETLGAPAQIAAATTRSRSEPEDVRKLATGG